MSEELELCSNCNLTDGYCECVECEHCGELEDPHEMYQSRCRSCEDEQMVRSIW